MRADLKAAFAAFTLSLVLAPLSISLAMPVAARADAPVTLIRTYDSDVRGLVYEVCRGGFNPPSTDPQNPAYCRGQPEYWSQSRWQAYNRSLTQKPSQGKDSTPTKPPKSPGKAEGEVPNVATGTNQSEAASQSAIPYGGSLDPTTVLGLTNPLCGARGELSAEQARNCQSSRSPEAAYPVGNYGWDIHIEQGGFITSLLAPAVSFVLQIFSVIWLILLLILKGCLIVLGFTFSLSPFTNNHMLTQIGAGLNNFYSRFTEPWLTTLMVIIGLWALYNGIVRRRAGETIGGIVASLLMMMAALWMIHSPGETVGLVSNIINKTSLVAVSAPSTRSTNAPVSSYNDAMSKVWNEMTEVPFCAMDFSDVHWCLDSKPSKEAMEAAKDGVDPDEPFGKALMLGLPKDEDAAVRVLNRRMQEVFGTARSIADLYLRFSPGSGPRDALWKFYNGESDEHVGLPLEIGPQIDIGGGSEGKAPEKVAMQGRSGLLPRMVLVLIFALGLIGGVLLLLWIAMKLVMATASSFVLVLLAPVAMFFPAFGQAGRTAFTRWGTSLIGALVAKLVFSALLGVVLLGSQVLGAGVGGSSPTLGLVATMAFWWAVFLNRERYLALMQIDPIRDQSGGFYRTMAGGYVGYRVAKAAKGAITKRRHERQGHAQREHEGELRAGREEGEQALGRQAQERLDVATSRAKGRDADFSRAEKEVAALRRDPEVRTQREDPSALRGEAAERAQRKAAALSHLEETVATGQSTAMADRQLLGRVRANEAAGLPRHSRADIEGAKDAIRRESSLGDDAPEHHWRAQAAGVDPKSAAGRAAIAKSLAETRGAVGATSAGRLEQVDLHRVRGRRRADGGLRRDPPAADGGSDGVPRPRRGSRGREGLSR
jgi:hypothetical protein